jgi:Domain of unknown function (DUF4936)
MKNEIDSAPATHLFVYFKVNAEEVGEITMKIRKIQSALTDKEPKLQAAIFRRPGSSNGEVTIMETYASSDGISETTKTNIEKAFTECSLHIKGVRHVEVFEMLAG